MSKAPCYCVVRACNGKSRTASVIKNHLRTDVDAKRLRDEASPEVQPSEGEEGVREYVLPRMEKIPDVPLNPNVGIYRELHNLDEELRQIMDDLATTSPNEVRLKAMDVTISGALATCIPSGNSALEMVHQAMLETALKAQGQVSELRLLRVSLAAQHSDPYDTTKFHRPMFHDDSIIVVGFLLVVLVLNLFGNVTRRTCNGALKALEALMKLSVSINHPMTQFINKDLDKFPRDIRQLFRKFELRPTLTIYATCPKCSSTYKPEKLPSGALQYEVICRYKKYPRSRPCETLLLKGQQRKAGPRTAIGVPLRPYPHQSIEHYLAKLLSLPNIEEVLTLSHQMKHLKRDVWDGELLQSIKGPDGKPFTECPDGELRLFVNTSTDWLNPEGNKIAGKHHSVAPIFGSLLNLPASLRIKLEYIYLGAIIPGPHEPGPDQINHFLRPVVDDLERMWEHGRYFTKTSMYPNGRHVRVALAQGIADMPGSRKVFGGIAPKGSQLDPFFLKKAPLESFNNIEGWVLRTDEEFRAAAEEYRMAPSAAAAKGLLRKNGLRWTEFLRLKYWSPTRSIVVDPMHTWFLNNMNYHLRNVICIDTIVKQPLPTISMLTAKQMTKAEKVWNAKDVKNRTVEGLGKLYRLTKIEMLYLCGLRGVVINDPDGKLKKKVTYNALLAGPNSTLSSNKNRPERLRELNGPMFDVGSKIASRSGVMDSEDIIGEAYIDDLDITEEAVLDKLDTLIPVLSSDERECIRQWIRITNRPPNSRGPPPNLGENSHGKLKADTLRTLFEFDLPVALAQLWANEPRDTPQSEQRYQLWRSTMMLATAVGIGEQDEITEEDTVEYTRWMTLYVKSLRSLFPGRDIRPSHRTALLLGRMLILHGPVKGWWAFVFERMNGILQRINTTGTIGELELTMMDTFYAKANLDHFIGGPQCPPTLAFLKPVVKASFQYEKRNAVTREYLGGDEDGAYIENVRAAPTSSTSRTETVEDDVKVAIDNASADIAATGCRLIPSPRPVPDCTIKGARYTAHRKSIKTGTIFFRRGGQGPWVPAKIRDIFVLPLNDNGTERQVLWFAVQRYKKAGGDPFEAEFSRYGAALWEESVGSVEILGGHEPICLAISRKYNDVLAMKAQSRVKPSLDNMEEECDIIED